MLIILNETIYLFFKLYKTLSKGLYKGGDIMSYVPFGLPPLGGVHLLGALARPIDWPP